MSVYGCNMSLELQQRAVEYNSIIRDQPNLKEGLFEQMPPMEMKMNQPYTNGFNADDLDDEILTEEEQQQQQIKQQQEAAKTLLNIFSDDAPATANGVTSPKPAVTNTQSNIDLLGDLMGGGDFNPAPVMQAAPTSNGFDDLFGLSGPAPSLTTQSSAKPEHSTDIFDLLGGEVEDSKPTNGTASYTAHRSNGLDDLLGGVGSSNTLSHTTTPTATAAPTSNSNDIFDLLGGSSESPKTPTNVLKSAAQAQVMAYDKNNVQITFESTVNARMNSSPSTQHFLTMTATNTGLSGPVVEFVFGAAVPRSMKMQLSQPKTSVIEPMESMQQTLAISNPNQVILSLF